MKRNKINFQLSDMKLDELWLKTRRGVLYALYLIGALLVQNVILSHVALFGVRAMFLPALVVAAALFEGGWGGGLFGLPGMILGVPVFAIIYAYTSGAINNKLREKEMPTDTLVYEDFSKYHIDKEEIFGKERFEAARRLGERDTKPAQRE